MIWAKESTFCFFKTEFKAKKLFAGNLDMQFRRTVKFYNGRTLGDSFEFKNSDEKGDESLNEDDVDRFSKVSIIPIVSQGPLNIWTEHSNCQMHK